ncbi:MAG: DUF4249 domain-containing protein [Saprospiraceae bacterium]|nr:DUF4249 domain-containing protein [Saprospiraceae bacterium]
MKYIIVIAFLLTCYGCVEEIEFDATGETGTLVVDGLLSTSSDSNFVFISRSNKVSSQNYRPETGAEIVLYDSNSKHEPLREISDGKYFFPKEIIQINVGNSYYIEITTKSGNQYKSEIETIQPVPMIDSLGSEFTFEDYTENETKVLQGTFYNLSVYGKVVKDDGALFLKWDVENIYLMTEKNCSPISGPKSCYVRNPINLNTVFLLDGTIYKSDAHFKQRVVHEKLDFTFGIASGFYVSQKSLTERAFKYWKRVDQILRESGTLLETPFAAIKGNIKSVENPDEEVLGYLSAVDERKVLKIVTKGELGVKRSKLPLCHPDLSLPPHIKPAVCCDCTLLAGASVKRPIYWP